MASWRADAITFATSATVGVYPCGIFINTQNTIYVADRVNGRIQMWLEGNDTPTAVVSNNLVYPLSLFVSSTGDIYIDNGYPNSRIDRWISGTRTSTTGMFVSKHCYGLFVDLNDTLYCSIADLNQVIAKLLNSGSDTLKVVAGTQCNEFTPYSLNSPRGIFVDINFDLYVADCYNHRIQRFRLGHVDGETMVVSGVSEIITLWYPTGVVLDADKHLFIVDSGNHRIIGSGPNGFRCVVGCFGEGTSPNQLNYPQSMAFDSHGNIFVVDECNHRVQQFVTITNSCGTYSKYISVK